MFIDDEDERLLDFDESKLLLWYSCYDPKPKVYSHMQNVYCNHC